MALNTSKCNHLTLLRFKGLKNTRECRSFISSLWFKAFHTSEFLNTHENGKGNARDRVFDNIKCVRDIGLLSEME